MMAWAPLSRKILEARTDVVRESDSAEGACTAGASARYPGKAPREPGPSHLWRTGGDRRLVSHGQLLEIATAVGWWTEDEADGHHLCRLQSRREVWMNGPYP